ncbi:penicillin-binding transpeptidase domain-containing protein [Leptospira santarosai]|uniref:penicillin-binding transpeptidase domain-containing protein n=1 Tax=Leptospira santarosai TaxID=28183 RepID=UPI000959D1FE|nr:penicillin-binding transpeptidase domain-containing protein [Leptospira santarosai]MDI7164880.1 penicillin-binding transpeptidase domain-containing protein [Leptospira santarosai]OLY62316.1 cell division protein FtsI [Leptospira santarosai serovar Guaricura]
MTRIFLVLICIQFLLYSETSNGIRFRYLDSAIQDFEKENSQLKSSVLILETESGIIRYVFRPELAIERKFGPGSLLKTFSALIFLKYKDQFSYSPSEKIHCEGRYYPEESVEISKNDLHRFHLPEDQNGKRYLRCSLREGHGRVDLEQALVQSCNVYFLKNASKNPSLFYSKLRSDFELASTSQSRLIPYKETPGNFEESPTDLRKVSSSIGEGGFLLSPLKVSQLYASVWSGGPRLAQSWEASEKRIKVSDNPFSGRDIHFVLSALSSVPKTGTLKELKMFNDPKISILGAKTGTGTIYTKKYETHGWITLYFRMKRKNYLMTVFVEKGSGGKQAQSLVLKILNEIGKQDLGEKNERKNKKLDRKIEDSLQSNKVENTRELGSFRSDFQRENLEGSENTLFVLVRFVSRVFNDRFLDRKR